MTFEGRCKEKHLSFELILTGQTLFVRADMSKIEQVVYNLIDNAIQVQPQRFYDHDRNDRKKWESLCIGQRHRNRHPEGQPEQDLGTLLQDGSLPWQGQEGNRSRACHRKGDHSGTRRKYQCHKYRRSRNGIYLHAPARKGKIRRVRKLTTAGLFLSLLTKKAVFRRVQSLLLSPCV